jgi:outer membrane receptor protein involved in Fe transport
MLAVLSPVMFGGAVYAQETAPPAASTAATDEPDEIVVTASRRAEAITDLPFNISAYDGEALARANITNVTGLAQQVPNFAIENRGARSVQSAIPIIRGINASQPALISARYFQSPVGFYLENAPITGSLPLFDVERIEVLRGPQGTLYGAGALSGAVRIVPVGPEVGEFSGFVTGSVSATAHSKDPSYTFGGALNFPLGEVMALRVSANHQYEAGFINQKDIFQRANDDYVSGAPVLADPNDVANSSGVLFNKSDVNYARTTSARAALAWEPSSETEVELAYNFARTKGNGGPLDNNKFEGGPFPIDPRLSTEPTGEYERSLPMLEPFDRDTHLATLDASHDMGFATVSATAAFGYSKGDATSDQTVALLGVPYGFYYTGAPANPRAVVPVTNDDTDRSFTQEVRLVSNGTSTFDYIAGVFFQQQRKKIGLGVFAPGAGEQSAAANGGSTVPIALGGTYILTNPNGQSYDQDTVQRFRDYSAYGELTWNVTDRWRVTGGARVFHQTFRQHLTAESTFFFFTLDERAKDSLTSQTFKLNTSYDLNDDVQVYATWSQGYRRGGANAFPLEGPVLEPETLLIYKPDKTDNFEVGAKGRLGGILFSADVFYVRWSDPQIDLLTPFNLSNAVVNGEEATSKGAELELSGPIGETGFSFNVGGAYAKARLSEDFALPAGLAGEVIPGAIAGNKGDRLPGAPDWSGSATLTYEYKWSNDSSLTTSIGADYRSSTLNQLESINPNSPTRRSPGYTLLRGSIAFETGPWTFELFGTNLTDKRAVLSKAVRTLSSYETLGNWGENYVVSRPRELGLRLTRRF